MPKNHKTKNRRTSKSKNMSNISLFGQSIITSRYATYEKLSTYPAIHHFKLVWVQGNTIQVPPLKWVRDVLSPSTWWAIPRNQKLETRVWNGKEPTYETRPSNAFAMAVSGTSSTAIDLTEGESGLDVPYSLPVPLMPDLNESEVHPLSFTPTSPSYTPPGWGEEFF